MCLELSHYSLITGWVASTSRRFNPSINNLAQFMSPNIFISYSREDSALIETIVALMRTACSYVFLDPDSIQLGQKWRPNLSEAIHNANIVTVFWSSHANSSNEVTWEYEQAIEYQKDVLPLLLDSTPLPSKLHQYECLDFQSVAGGKHGALTGRIRQKLARLYQALYFWHPTNFLLEWIPLATFVFFFFFFFALVLDFIPFRVAVLILASMLFLTVFFWILKRQSAPYFIIATALLKKINPQGTVVNFGGFGRNFDFGGGDYDNDDDDDDCGDNGD